MAFRDEESFLDQIYEKLTFFYLNNEDPIFKVIEENAYLSKKALCNKELIKLGFELVFTEFM